MKLVLIFLAAGLVGSTAVAQSKGEIGHPTGALGYDALVKANYRVAEQQILSDTSSAQNDPAKLINLGQIYSKTGRLDMAIRVLETASRMEEVELILANGETISSREAARKSLAALRK